MTPLGTFRGMNVGYPPRLRTVSLAARGLWFTLAELWAASVPVRVEKLCALSGDTNRVTFAAWHELLGVGLVVPCQHMAEPGPTFAAEAPARAGRDWGAIKRRQRDQMSTVDNVDKGVDMSTVDNVDKGVDKGAVGPLFPPHPPFTPVCGLQPIKSLYSSAAEHKAPKKAKTPAELPGWIPPGLWAEYREMREKIRKPMTARAIEIAIKNLEQFRADGHDIQAILEQSIFNAWQGLFPPKGGTRGDRSVADQTRRNAAIALERIETRAANPAGAERGTAATGRPETV